MHPAPTPNPLIKLDRKDHSKIHPLFQRFDYFTNYIQYAIANLEPEIWVDDNDKTNLAIFYTPPAYFLAGDPHAGNVSRVFEQLTGNNYLVPSSETWDRPLNDRFGSRLETIPRTSFHSSSLSLEHLRSLQTELPSGLQIVPIRSEQVNDLEGMLYQDLLKKFFVASDFLQCGAGFCLLEGQKIIGFAASNYPIRDNILEVYVRVDYNSDPRHRHKGLGTVLSATLLEYCLLNGLDPQWDAANEISVRLALKLGYTRHLDWKMYHLCA